MNVTAQQRRATMDERLRDILSHLRDGIYERNEEGVYHALNTAWHDGWRVGFEEYEEVQQKYGPNLDAIAVQWFVAGVGIGAAIMAAVHFYF